MMGLLKVVRFRRSCTGDIPGPKKTPTHGKPVNSQISANAKDRKKKYRQGEEAYKRSNTVGTRREQSLDPEKLSYTQFEAKIVKRSEFLKDRFNVHEAIKNMVRAIRVPHNRCQKEKNIRRSRDFLSQPYHRSPK